MIIATGGSSATDSKQAVDEAWQQLLEQTSLQPKLIICNASANYAADTLQQRLNELAGPECTIAGSSSCMGVMNEQAILTSDGCGLSLIAFADDDGDFGAAVTALGADPTAAAATAIRAAIDDADRPGELPELIWLSAAPGCEEAVLAGIESVVGPNVPVIGGSSGDNDIAGNWWQFDRNNCEQQGVMVVALYPACEFGISFHSGYAPTAVSGVITSADGRVIHTIDDEAAASVYNRWTEGLIESSLEGGNILAASTFRPLGREAGRIQDIPYYALLHPEQVLTDGSISLFSDVHIGETLTLMEGSPESLVRRAGTATAGIIAREGWHSDQIAGALVVYCAGCMLGVQNRLDEVSFGLHQALEGKPFQAMFTFGEQGCFIDGTNRHANLMIASIVFANPA